MNASSLVGRLLSLTQRNCASRSSSFLSAQVSCGRPREALRIFRIFQDSKKCVSSSVAAAAAIVGSKISKPESTRFKMTKGMKARWSKVEGLSSTSESGPGVRSSHGMSAVEGKGEGNHNEVWVVGGEAKAREPAGMDVFCLKVGEGEGEGEGKNSQATWSRYPASEEPGKAPEPRNAHGQAAIGDCIYVFGGRKGIQLEVSFFFFVCFILISLSLSLFLSLSLSLLYILNPCFGHSRSPF